MSQQQYNEMNYYRTASDNMYRFYNELYNLSILDLNIDQNVAIVINYFRNLGHTTDLQGINNIKQLKNLVVEKMNLYLRLAENFEKNYDRVYEQIYFPFSVSHVGI